jgi:YgiT-type zinc finger domain-containing protein
MYGYRYAHCQGTVRPKKVAREAFKHKKGFIILEDIVIGICDSCGARYYTADILHVVNDIANGTKPFERVEEIPVAHLSTP